MRFDPKPSRRYAEYTRKIACDEWVVIGATGNDKVVIQHRPSGATAAYCLHDGGNDWNGPRNFALDVQRACGCQLIQPRGRKKSRKSLRPAEDPQLEAARRKHAEEFQARADERDRLRAKEEARQISARVAAEQDRRRREIEDLMR
jgi:hypothetical protein